VTRPQPQARAIIWYSVTVSAAGGISSTCTAEATRPGAPARPAPHPPHVPGSMTRVSSGRAAHARLAPGWPFCPPCGRARRVSRRRAFFFASAAGPSRLGAARSSRSPGPPAGAAPRPRPAVTRSARPAPPPPPAVPRPAPSARRSGQPAPHTTADPDSAPPNQTMITKRTPAPTRHSSTGGLTGCCRSARHNQDGKGSLCLGKCTRTLAQAPPSAARVSVLPSRTGKHAISRKAKVSEKPRVRDEKCRDTAPGPTVLMIASGGIMRSHTHVVRRVAACRIATSPTPRS
jgi:hypothetical protein